MGFAIGGDTLDLDAKTEGNVGETYGKGIMRK